VYILKSFKCSWPPCVANVVNTTVIRCDSILNCKSKVANRELPFHNVIDRHCIIIFLPQAQS
jgi:hypothetical protein